MFPDFVTLHFPRRILDAAPNPFRTPCSCRRHPGGRITDVEGIPGNPALVYVATASGGLFKTTNAGTTWTPTFDHQATISIGNIAVDPHNPDVVWVGTGEANARNSVSFGDGACKTLDGGKSWRNLGLSNTHHISASSGEFVGEFGLRIAAG